MSITISPLLPRTEIDSILNVLLSKCLRSRLPRAQPRAALGAGEVPGAGKLLRLQGLTLTPSFPVSGAAWALGAGGLNWQAWRVTRKSTGQTVTVSGEQC